MSIIIATGGLDEVAIAISYVIFTGIFGIVAGLVALSWWKRSLVAAVAASIFVLLGGAMIQPWMFVVSRPSDGPYDQSWQFKMRVFSVVWLLLVIFAVAGLVRVIHHRKVKTDAPHAA